MKIVSLRVQNYQRVKAVEIHPEGNIVRITGANGQGKSSVLDAMWAAIGGSSRISADPIHEGAKEAMIEVDLGDLLVTRVIKEREDGTTLPMLVVKSKDGNKFADGQTVLKKLAGALTFDPLAFTRAKPSEQLATLRGFVSGFDFEANDKARKDTFELRTDINRDAKKLWAQVEAIPAPEGEPAPRIDEEGLTLKLEQAVASNGAIETEAAERRRLSDMAEGQIERAKTARSRAAELREQADQLDGTATGLEADAKRIQDDVAGRGPLAAEISLGDIREELAKARQHNRLVDEDQRTRRERANLVSQAKAKDEESGRLTEIIDQCDAEQEAAVRAAKMPVPGLAFSADGVLLNGHPFDQASSSEKIRASVAIASAMNPTLRVIQVREGSLLDSAAKKLIADFAEQNDMQFWIEEVDETGDEGFVIEDGLLKAPILQAAE